MGITLGSNIASLKAQRTLGVSTERLSRTFERLSSGQRINRASDDAAGLAIADSLKASQRVATVAIRNANDGISTIAIADSALGEIGNVLSRLAELAEQSANGVFSTTQRSALSNEFVALASEIERIAVTTQFNGVTLLSGGSALTLQIGFSSASTSQISFTGVQGTLLTLQIGFSSASTSQISFTGVQGTLAALGLANANSSALSYSIQAASVDGAQSASRLALDAINAAITSLASTRGTLGATESRLQVAINSLSVARENFAAAESRIRDVDVATEAAELTRLNILQQAGAAVLAQANQQPSLALSLLR